MAQNQQYYNIPRDVKDMFYRYKMPRLISKIEGRGNGIKTVIPNMTDVAKSLDRPATYTTKYFGCELGALVSCDVDKDKYLVNGSHDVERLQKALDGFISKFVLCGECGNPETDLNVSKDDRITRICKACGGRSPVDLTHKLCAFIIKNPPPKKKVKKNAAAAAVAAAVEAEQDGEDDELTKRIHEEAAQLGDRTIVDDDDWAESTTAEAVAERMKNLAVKPKVAEEEDDNDDPVEGFANFLTENPKADDAEIVAEAYSLGIKEYKVVVVLMQVLFDADILTQLPKRIELLSTFTKDEKGQKGLIGGLERLIMSHKKELIKKTPLIMKMIYDEELVEEEVFLKWGEKVSRKYVDKETSRQIHEAAEQFLEWLKTADEEDSDEE